MIDPDRASRLRGFHQRNSFRLERVTELMERAVRDTVGAAGLSAHQITARTKIEDSFVAKGCKTLGAAGSHYKYDDPERQITDVVGVRVVVPLAGDIHSVASALRTAFDVREEEDRGNEPEVEVPGYRSLHMVVRMRPDSAELRAQPNLGDTSTEIQVRTILQDALASFQHDLIYKAESPPTPKIKRRLTELAALLGIADREFSTVRAAHISDTEAVAELSEPTERVSNGFDPRAAVSQIIGPQEEDPDVWLYELSAVLQSLGLDNQDAMSALRPQLSHGSEIATRLRTRQPWLTGSQVLDRLLRWKLGDTYFDARATTIAPQNLGEARKAFHAERGEIAAMIEALQ